ncbi:MAG: ABC transporter permease [Bdellovibrionales bacterium]
MTWKLITAALFRQKRLYIPWALSLCAALTGLGSVDIYRQSLTETLHTQGRKILTADISVSARRRFTPSEQELFISTLPSGSSTAHLVEMFGMIRAGDQSRLGLLRFVSDAYPLAGELDVRIQDESHTRTGAELRTRPAVWVAPDLLTLLNTRVGARLRVGEKEFEIAGIVVKDSSQTFRLGDMAPRVYVHDSFLEETGLVKFGSTFSNILFAVLPGTADGIKNRMEKVFTEPGIRVTVPMDLENGPLRILTRLLDYLGLIGLVTLCIGWVGVYYLGRRWLSLETQSAGVLKCMGLSARELQWLLVSKLALILTEGALLGGFVSWLGAELVFPLFRASLPPEFELVWSWKSALLLLLTGPVSGVLLLWPQLKTTASAKPTFLLQDHALQRIRWDSVFILGALSLGLVALLTLMQARSWMITGVFLSSLIGALILIASFGWLLIRLVRSLRRPHWHWPWHLASAVWIRRPGISLLLIIVSALAGLLSQLVPHLEATLAEDLRVSGPEDRPGLFMFDVQEEQLGSLKQLLDKHDIKIAQASPLIRARLVRVNNQEFERQNPSEWSTREEEEDARFRNRGVNLSYRTTLSSSERIVAGREWSELRVDPAEISVEQRYARRMGLRLGDQLVFDIQGVEVAATIASLREIRWTSFQPNFFIQFPPGVLDIAPKTWVLTLARNPRLPPSAIQTLVTSNFSNVTSINVEEALDNVTSLVAKMSSGLQVASWLTLLLGVFVFLMVLLFQVASSRRDWAQMQVQGLNAKELWRLQLLTYGVLAAAGSVLGALMSIAVAWVIAWQALSTRLELNWWGMSVVLAVTWVLALSGLSWISFTQLRRIPPRAALS